MEKSKSAGDLVVDFTFKGKEISLEGFSLDDWIYKSIKATKNFYEIDLLEYIRYVLNGKEDGVMIDIGANIGNHSVFFGSFIAGSVICFEPNPNVLPILKRNLSTNKIVHKLFELGLGDKPGYASVQIPSGHENNVGAAKLVTSSDSSSTITISTLDMLIPEINDVLQGRNILAIKIDVEGMEPNVLNGGKVLISTYKPEIFIEVTDINQMGRIEPILINIGYYKIISYAATPVWHFSHRSKTTLLNLLRIKSYIYLDKFKKKLASYASIIIRLFK